MTLDSELDRAFAPWGYYVSDPGPDVTLDLCIDDPDAHARMLAQLMPDWPAPKSTGYGFRGPYFGDARHQWALYSAGTAEHAELLIRDSLLRQALIDVAEEDREWLSFTPTLEEWPCVEHTVAPKSISVQRCEGLLGEHPQYKTSRYPGEWPGREYGQWEVAHYDHCEPLDECPICPGGES